MPKPGSSAASAEACFHCENVRHSINYLHVESAVQANLMILGGLADVSGWIMTHCPYCCFELYWGRK